MEMAVLLRADSEQAASKVLAEAAKEYEISVDVISTAVSKEFAEREKANAAKKPAQNRKERWQRRPQQPNLSIVIPTEPGNTGSNFFGPAAPIVRS